MNFVLDTNILLGYLQGKTFVKEAFEALNLLNSEDPLIISAVSAGELLSLAKQRAWSDTKYLQLNNFIEQFLIIPVESKNLLERYAEIDAYSQGKLLDKPLPQGISARNMGKNDLWIAATASLIDGILLTTDKDFLHLHKIYFELKIVEVYT
ncbi:MAG: type II toxin-antitoxin system VapC family toxin [Cytophagales bacterium]|nr:MAG: type II toxin-antitoxin system VapC family toxin [Cytophagales bacterium]